LWGIIAADERTEEDAMARLAGRAAALMIGLAAATAAAAAEPYPARPIRLIVSFPPAGSTDVIARAIQPEVERRLGQPVVIENRPGAGGNIGTEAVAKAAPDGYTIGMSAAGALAVNVSLLDRMPYDPLRDLAPVTLIGTSPFILATAGSFTGNSLAEVIAAAKASPGALSIGHGGNGTAMHLTVELLNHMAQVRLSPVPYRGTGPVVGDVLAGHIPLGMVDAPSAIAQIQSGQVKAIAVSSLQRPPMRPDVPTVAEAGLPGYESIGWYGIVAPAGTPPAIVARLNEAFVGVLNMPQIRERIRAVGTEPSPTTPAEFAAYIAREIAKWAEVIARSGVKAN
jgi:tripartite-type tricarboxylate transporter receptor subunit TctC